ncbi:succinate dehydrogenase, hydrophobic membrane anchor protein [Thorsellia anophelis]|uniref:Succinate dehydrogenase hydrophobic membrane anchor subunit n=1 Tax=Thorsellia anophelis DSM 18579 TaxID=1123402 RepID=A0A1I0EKH3_9GAMM|nr:succinate dehydrogenase, hydrophobic membrane anchor protein [Thorsellia anophelis]SET45958.1 succinate dehydrogenase / fumarate reductase membrane anchor subunit [Thorsellia anophelis DSM 18579]
MNTQTIKHSGAIGKKGVLDWILIRASALIITLYALYIFSFLIFSDINYENWFAFFSSPFTKVFTLITLVCILCHAWIGLWQVLTDYIKSFAVRFLLQVLVVFVLAVYVLYGVTVLWSV